MRRRAARAVGALAVVLCVLGTLPAAAATSPPLVPPATPGGAEVPAGWPAPPAVTADAYLLLDADTGQTLAAARADDRVPVASTVKILTAITVLARAELDTLVTAGSEADGFAADAAGVGLDAGERWTIDDLLEGLIARSGNDAANTLAVAVGGSVPGFVELMGEDAAALGLPGLTLTSPDGLDDGNRLSARDLATLTRVALTDERFVAIAARPVVELPDLGAVRSRNELLSTYPGAYGVKTGFTSASGRCLVAAAARDGRRLIAVVLGSDGPTDHFADARALLDFGFGRFAALPLAGAGPELELRTAGGWVAVDAPETVLQVPPDADVAVTAGLPTELDAAPGALQATAGSTTVATVPLETEQAAPPTDRAGAWLADRVYAAMRAATAEELWRP